MSSSQPPDAPREARIAELRRVIRAAEQELQALDRGKPNTLFASSNNEHAHRAPAEIQSDILNALPAHIAILDSDGVILSVNEAWKTFASANILNSTDFFVGQNYAEVCEKAQGEGAEEARAVAAALRRILRRQAKEFALEYPCHSLSEKRWFRLMITALSEKPETGAVVMHINITEQKRAEAALQMEHEFSQAVLNNIADGVVACDASGKLVLFNEVARNWHGLDPTDIPAEKWAGYYSLYGPDGVTPLTPDLIPLNRAYRGETVRAAEMTIVKKGWPPRHILGDCRPFFDAQHNLLGAVAVMHDITERKHADAALAAVQRQRELILASIGEGILGVDQDGRITFENRAARTMLGYLEKELIGLHAHSTIHHHRASGSIYPDEECPMSRTLADGQVRYSNEELFFRKNGTSFPVAFVSSPMQGDSGAISGAVVAFIDLTQHMRLETERQRAVDQLRVSEAQYPNPFSKQPPAYVGL